MVLHSSVVPDKLFETEQGEKDRYYSALKLGLPSGRDHLLTARGNVKDSAFKLQLDISI